jgi:hypothetical protein
VRELSTIVNPAETIVFLGPGREVAVNRFEIRNRKDVPAFLHVNLNIDDVPAEIFDIQDHLIEKMGIDKPVMGGPKSGYQLANRDGIPFFEGKLPGDDIVLCFAVALDADLSNDTAGGGDRIPGDGLSRSMKEQADR